MDFPLDPDPLHGEGVEYGEGQVAQTVLIVRLVWHLSQVVVYGHVISVLQQGFLVLL